MLNPIAAVMPFAEEHPEHGLHYILDFVGLAAVRADLPGMMSAWDQARREARMHDGPTVYCRENPVPVAAHAVFRDASNAIRLEAEIVSTVSARAHLSLLSWMRFGANTSTFP
jgi:hypothetical protein